jgi:hypothetical protein
LTKYLGRDTIKRPKERFGKKLSLSLQSSYAGKEKANSISLSQKTALAPSQACKRATAETVTQTKNNNNNSNARAKNQKTFS